MTAEPALLEPVLRRKRRQHSEEPQRAGDSPRLPQQEESPRSMKTQHSQK